MSEKKQVIFISDQFGYRCGGSNTVNVELCLALRQIAAEEAEIYSLVINCQDSDRIAQLEQMFSENFNKFDHVLVYEGKKEDLMDQIFRLFRAYE